MGDAYEAMAAMDGSDQSNRFRVRTGNPPQGWICPICGTGVAPWKAKCGCRQPKGVKG